MWYSTKNAITKDNFGNYTATFEQENLLDFFTLYKDFHAGPNDSVYIYSAIFSPPAFTTKVIDAWQYYDQTANKWTDEDKVELVVTGGRDGGFRTWSVKNGLAYGRWRVNVETETGQIIGTIRFNLVPPGNETLATEIKN